MQLTIESNVPIQPGDPVAIQLTTSRPETTDALRIAIDGVNTGWRGPAMWLEGALIYEWTAGEPDQYEIIGQIRTTGGEIQESRISLQVLNPAQAEQTRLDEMASGPIVAAAPGSVDTEREMRPENETATDALVRDDEATIPPTSPLTLPAIWETTVTLPTYPYWDFQSAAYDAAYAWPYKRFDPDAFAAAAPAPQLKTYRVVVLENEHLRLEILPELGGRIWQVEHKATGNAVFYQNPVVKPSPWGPSQQLGWLALGGMEWGAPVYEHGYDWGTSWELETLPETDSALRVVVSTPADGRLLSVSIEISLPSDGAYFEIAPQLINHANDALDYDFWLNAMLAPGAGNAPGPETQFILPGRLMQVHSRGDAELPGDAQPLRWPHYGTRDLSILGEYNHYMGFFEYPQAQGPFAAVYDPAADAGLVRVYPASRAQGSKIFTLGWEDPIPSQAYTDDGTAYVELHGGIAPSFFEQATLAAGATLTWRERWYPVQGMNGVSYADSWGALHTALDGDTLTVELLPVAGAPGTVVIQLLRGSYVIDQQQLDLQTGVPAQALFKQLPAPQDITEIRVAAPGGEETSLPPASLPQASLSQASLSGDIPGTIDSSPITHRPLKHIFLSYYPGRN